MKQQSHKFNHAQHISNKHIWHDHSFKHCSFTVISVFRSSFFLRSFFLLIFPLSHWGAPDREFCYPAGSGSMPDPDMSDPAESRPDPSHSDPAESRSSQIRIQTSTTADNRRKITLSAPLLEKLEWLFTLFCDRTSTWVIISVWH